MLIRRNGGHPVSGESTAKDPNKSGGERGDFLTAERKLVFVEEVDQEGKMPVSLRRNLES